MVMIHSKPTSSQKAKAQISKMKKMNKKQLASYGKRIEKKFKLRDEKSEKMTGLMVFISKGSEYPDEVRFYQGGASIDFTGQETGQDDFFVVEALEKKIPVYILYRDDDREFRYLGCVDYTYPYQVIQRGQAVDTTLMRFKVVTSIPSTEAQSCGKLDLPSFTGKCTYGYKNGAASYLGFEDKLMFNPVSTYMRSFVPIMET